MGVIIFLSCICVGRFGLDGFFLGSKGLDAGGKDLMGFEGLDAGREDSMGFERA